MAGVTRCRNAEINAEWDAPTDALGFWQSRGWEPITGQSRSVAEAEAERVDAENAAAEQPSEPAPTEPPLPPAAQDPPEADAPGVEQSQITPTAGDAGTQKES